MKVYGKTDPGRVRRNNEDSFFVSEGPVGIFDQLMVVADGMGGHMLGEVASQTAVQAFANFINEAEPDSPAYIMENACYAANLAVRKISAKRKSYGMGTTLVAAGIVNDRVYIANIGDSRLYFLDGDGITMRQITRDHSFVEEQVDKGLMERGSEEYEQQKNIITRAVGIYSEVEPDIFEFILHRNRYLLLCSDGLSNMVPESEMKSIALDEDMGLKKRVESLVNVANNYGGKDNITVVLYCSDEVKE